MIKRRQILAVVSALLLNACAHLAPSASNNITLINASRLSKLIDVSEPVYQRSDSGTLSARCQVVNRANTRMKVEARATFNSATATEEPSGWQLVFIERDSSAAMNFLSLSAQATAAKIEIREAP